MSNETPTYEGEPKQLTTQLGSDVMATDFFDHKTEEFGRIYKHSSGSHAIVSYTISYDDSVLFICNGIAQSMRFDLDSGIDTEDTVRESCDSIGISAVRRYANRKKDNNSNSKGAGTNNG